MHRSFGIITVERVLMLCIGILMLISIVILNSIASTLFPLYFVYIISAILVFILFSRIDFEIFLVFSPYLYVLSLIFLFLPLAVGEITRGSIRWLQIGSITLQPSELVRPFLLLYFAKFVSKNTLSVRNVLLGSAIFSIPIFLIVIQPSFGVAFLTSIGLIGVLMSSNIPKKHFIGVIVFGILSLPLLWFLLAPYQRQRVMSFLNPSQDPLGAGYNSLQSMISIGSGRIFGRGLGEGVQTQLAFLPEKHSDFVFAAIAEEMGFIGTFLVLISIFILYWSLITIAETVKTKPGRAFIVGTCLSLFVETMIHTGMNMGLLPITGVPFPLVSAGGSALLGTMMSLGIVISAKRARYNSV